MKLFFLIAFSPAVAFVLYDIFFYYRPIFYGSCGALCPDVLVLMLYSDFCAILSFGVSFLCIKFIDKRKKSLMGDAGDLPDFLYGLLLFVIVLLYAFLVYSVFGSLNILEVFADYDRFYTMNSYGAAWVFLLFNIILFLMLYDIYRVGFNKNKLFLFLLSLMVVVFTGGRSMAVVLLSLLLFLLVVVNNVKINASYYAGALILAVLVFGGNSLLRLGGVDNYVESATSLDFDNSFILNDVIDHVDKNGPEYLISLQDFYYFFIPRYFSEEKPVSTAETRLIYPEVAERSTNYTFGIYANVLLNFGYYGLIFLPILIFI
jgi:hypothetical protein